MKSLKFYVSLSLFFMAGCSVQELPDKASKGPNRPKLVIGIVVDQMRYDYIYRYWDQYSDHGIKKLVNKGFSCRNTRFNYVPTYTGPGHASIYTGTTPSTHGIIANQWYNRSAGALTYCVGDSMVSPVGTENVAGKMSPRNMLCTTIGDEMKLATNMRSKVIGISLKDRAAILPAGHSADAAYWYNSSEGTFITSSHYMSDLPDWVNTFNAKKLPDQYLGQNWELLKDLSAYTASDQDDTPYEMPFIGETNPVFPHMLPDLRQQNFNYNMLKATPFGNSIITQLAMTCMESENLGKGKETDMLFVSYSATDVVGHQFGPQSMEMEDTYLRFDLEIAQLLEFLDKTIGQGHYLAFFTADHGAVSVPNYLIDKQIPAGYTNEIATLKSLKEFALTKYGDSSLVKSVSNEQVFLDRVLMAKKGLDASNVQQTFVEKLLTMEGIMEAYGANTLRQNEFTRGLAEKLQAGYSHTRSGDILFVLKPSWIDHPQKGTTHGSGNPYDTHIPLIWYGWGSKNGESFEEAYITDIAPTICAMLSIQEPNCSSGKVITEVLGK